eukprot:scaffold221018_cov48-Prasinocladus_malaysianus.AAC.1
MPSMTDIAAVRPRQPPRSKGGPHDLMPAPPPGVLEVYTLSGRRFSLGCGSTQLARLLLPELPH